MDARVGREGDEKDGKGFMYTQKIFKFSRDLKQNIGINMVNIRAYIIVMIGVGVVTNYHLREMKTNKK